MKLTCTQENFKKAIYSTERVIGKQTTLPILENILLEIERGMLKISATNLEIGVFLKIGAKIEEEGKITVPARIIGNFINNLPPGENISLETSEQLLKIKSGNYKASIKGLNANDFPIIPEMKSSYLFSFLGSELREFLPKLLTCVSLDGTRPELGGINIVLEENEVNMAATDSFRLLEARVKIKKEKNEEYSIFINKTNSLIIPANAVAEVLRAISPETQEIKVFIEENQIFFQVDNVRIVSRLINGKYPEYKQIIPKEFSTEVIADKENLLRAVKIASFFTNSKAGEVNFTINSDNGEIDVFSQSEEKGENRTKIKAKIKGASQEIVFNPRYILDGLSAITTPLVAVLANGGSSPAVLRIAEDNEEKTRIDEKLTYVVMPIKN